MLWEKKKMQKKNSKREGRVLMQPAVRSAHPKTSVEHGFLCNQQFTVLTPKKKP